MTIVIRKKVTIEERVPTQDPMVSLAVLHSMSIFKSRDTNFMNENYK